MEQKIWFTWLIIFSIINYRLLWIYLIKHEKKNDNPYIRIQINKIEHRIPFKIILMPENKLNKALKIS